MNRGGKPLGFGKQRAPMLSTYVLQQADKSTCPLCGQHLSLLCDHKGNVKKPWFYICWTCRNITQVGVGPVVEEGQLL